MRGGVGGVGNRSQHHSSPAGGGLWGRDGFGDSHILVLLRRGPLQSPSITHPPFSGSRLGVCSSFSPAPRYDLLGLSPLSPRGPSVGCGLQPPCWEKAPVPAVPSHADPVPLRPRESSWVLSPPQPAVTTALATAGGHSWRPQLAAEPLCRAEAGGSRIPFEVHRECQGCCMASPRGLSPSLSHGPLRGCWAGPALLPRKGAGGSRREAELGPRASSIEHMICCGRFPAAWSQPGASAGDGFNCFQIR